MRNRSSADGVHARPRPRARARDVARRPHHVGAGVWPGVAGVEHVGVDAHRAQAATLHALVAVGDREPLGEGHGGVLGHGVRRRADLGEQPGGRRGRAEVAVAARDPAGHEAAGGVVVGLGVDRRDRSQSASDVSRSAPSPMPALAKNRSMGPKVASAGSMRRRSTGRRRHVAGHRQRHTRAGPPRSPRRPGGAGGVEVGHHHRRRAPSAAKRRAERPADPAGAAGDHRDLVRELHGRRW